MLIPLPTLLLLLPPAHLALVACGPKPVSQQEGPQQEGPQQAGPQQAIAPPSENAYPQGRPVTQLVPAIWNLHQDRQGQYWFGSQNSGAFRHDGQRLTQYTTREGLAGDQVRGFWEDDRGRLLISTNSGVSLLDDGSLRTLEIREPNEGESGWLLEPGDLWLCSSPGESGPLRFDGEILHQLQLKGSPIESEFQRRFPDVSFNPYGLYTLYEDRRGHVWFGTSSLGLCRFDGETLAWMYEERLTTTPSGGAFGIRSIFEDSQGSFWICNTRQRFQVSDGIREEAGFPLVPYQKSPGLPAAQDDEAQHFTYYHVMAESPTGALWMSCGSDGVWEYHEDQVTRHPLGEGAYAIGLLVDRNGQVWAGTSEHGVYRLENGVFKNVQLPANPTSR